MAYKMHRGGDLYVEMLDQFNNHHGEYEPATPEEVSNALREMGGEVLVANEEMDAFGFHLLRVRRPGIYLVYLMEDE